MHLVNKVLLLPRGPTEAARLGGLNGLVQNLMAVGLLDTVEGSPALTIFSPTNEVRRVELCPK